MLHVGTPVFLVRSPAILRKPNQNSFSSRYARTKTHTVDKKSSIIILFLFFKNFFTQISCTYKHKTVTYTYIDIELKK